MQNGGMVEEGETKCKTGTIFIQMVGERWMNEQRDVSTGCSEMGMLNV
jgi:hypothetical protein